jgi:hypothetical protein
LFPVEGVAVRPDKQMQNADLLLAIDALDGLNSMHWHHELDDRDAVALPVALRDMLFDRKRVSSRASSSLVG